MKGAKETEVCLFLQKAKFNSCWHGRINLKLWVMFSHFI